MEQQTLAYPSNALDLSGGIGFSTSLTAYDYRQLLYVQTWSVKLTGSISITGL